MDSLPGVLAAALRDNRPEPVAAAAVAGDGGAAAAPRPVTSRDLRDRKVPDFWLAAPEAWFQILDEHLESASPALTEAKKFPILLPLLQDQAVKIVLRLVRSLTPTVYQTAKEALIRTFKRSDDDMITELFGLSSLGDRSAVEHLEHMKSLQPGEPETKLFKHIFVRCLPAQVAAIVADRADLNAMAAAADVIIATLPDLTKPSVSSLVTWDDDGAGAFAVSHPAGTLIDGLCFIHKRYGDKAFKCAAPETCRLRKVLCKRPQRSSTSDKASGNAPAGRQ